MGLLGWLKEPGTRGRLIRQMYSDDPKEARAAADDARRRGYLTDMSMRGADLSEANLPDADLSGADLKDVIFKLANLTNAKLKNANLAEATLERATLDGASLVETNLQMAVLDHASLQRADLSDADLGAASLYQADLTGVSLKGALMDDAGMHRAVVTDEQLQQARTLAGATLPDGEMYDGRFNLAGDLIDAEEAGVSADRVEDMARFYGIPVEVYKRGQAWAAKNMSAKKKASGGKAAKSRWSANSEGDEDVGLDRRDPGSYLDLMEQPFKDRDRWEQYLSDWDNAKTARRMAGWLSATLLWLPLLLVDFKGLIELVVLASKAQSPFLSGLETISLITIIQSILFVVGWIMTALAFNSLRGGGTVYRIFAIVFAFFAYNTGAMVGGIAVVIGSVIAQILAYYYGSRAARSVTFGVSALLLVSAISLAITPFTKIEVFFPFDQESASMTRWVLVNFALTAAYIVLAIGVVTFIRHAVREFLLKEIGKRRNTAIIRELEIGYAIAFVLLIVLAVNSFVQGVQG